MTSRPSQRRRARVTDVIQSLEPRRLLAVIDCTNASDTIRLFMSGSTQHVEVNGFDLPVGDSTIIINALGGNDSIIVTGTKAGTTIDVNGGEGSDSVTNTLTDLDACYPGNFAFDGGNGDDSFIANNSTDVGATTILIQPQNIVRNGNHFLFDYFNIENLTYLDSSASNDIRFINLNLSQVSIRNLTINGNGGDDVIANYRFSDAGFMPTSFAVASTVVNGGAGNDELRLSDNANVGGTYTMDALTFSVNTIDPPGPMSYAAFESMELLTSTHADAVVVNGKPAAMSLIVESVGGNDEFRVGGGDLDSNGLRLSNTTLFGGIGNDNIIVDDHLDAESASEVETYTMEINSLAKGGGGFVYAGFDAQSIQLADRINGSVLIGNIVNLSAIQGTIASTTLTGGSVRDTEVNFAFGNLLSLSGSFTIDLGAASGTINVNDQNDTGNDNYTITNAQVTKTVNGSTQTSIAYQNVAFVAVNANADANNIAVLNTRAGTPVSINAGGGNDSIRMANGNVGADLLAPVFINGGAGSNELSYNNMNDAAPGSQTLNGTAFTDGVTHSANSVSSIAIENGTGGGTLDIVKTSVFTFASSSSFDQTVNIGGGNLDANLLGDVSISTAGNVTVDDRLDAGNDGYLVNLLSFRKTGLNARTVSVNNVAAAILQANDGNNAIQVSNGGNLLRLFGNGGNDNFTIADSVPFLATETINIDTGPEQGSLVEPFGDYVTVNSDAGTSGDAPARVSLMNDDTVLRLTVNAGGTFQVPANVVCLNGQLNLPGGTLDLAGGALLQRGGGTTLTAFRRLLQIGHNGGTWNGIDAQQGSINSSPAAASSRSDGVGYAPGSQVGLTTIGSFTIGPNDTLVRYTLNGDANLDGQVNLNDFNRLAANFGETSRQWFEGDFNYDGNVNLDDFNLLAGNFGSAV